MSAETPLITVMVVDDQGIVRDGLIRIVDASPSLRVVGVAANGREAVAVARARRPDVILMDVRMPLVDGIEATRAILQEDSRARVLALTTFDSDAYAVRMLQAGAVGFVLKDCTADELVDAIRSAFHGTMAIAATTARRLVRKMSEHETPVRDLAALRSLTDRERTVFHLAASGLSNAEIAQRLCISQVTVKSHIGRVLSKLEVRDRVHLVLWALHNGALPGVEPEGEG